MIDFPEVGFDPELFNGSAPGERRQIDGKAVFLFAGRLVPYKHAEIVVSAFAASRELRQHKLQIVGEGREHATLESPISKHQLGKCH
jgi:glycosyltransferase involved in cell wall biosynthesis